MRNEANMTTTEKRIAKEIGTSLDALDTRGALRCVAFADASSTPEIMLASVLAHVARSRRASALLLLDAARDQMSRQRSMLWDGMLRTIGETES